MPHCTKCGAMISEGAAFCPNCGQAQQAAAPSAAGTQSGLSENLAGLLCYALGWITGLIFLLIDKRPFVRFHAAQSLVVFGGLHILRIVLGVIVGVSWFTGGPAPWTGFSVGILLLWLIGLASFVLWIVLMVKAYQGQRFEVPFASDIARSLVGK
jgi:uncharacterized membrane protein